MTYEEAKRIASSPVSDAGSPLYQCALNLIGDVEQKESRELWRRMRHLDVQNQKKNMDGITSRYLEN